MVKVYHWVSWFNEALTASKFNETLTASSETPVFSLFTGLWSISSSVKWEK